MNANCLAGKKCPQCGNEDRLSVQASVWAVVTDNGIDETVDFEYGGDAAAFCPECQFTGTWAQFDVAVRGCSCGMADYGAPGHDGHHPEHEECADGCGLDVTHDGACLDKPGGRQVCDHEEPDPTPVERWQVTTPPDVYLTEED